MRRSADCLTVLLVMSALTLTRSATAFGGGAPVDLTPWTAESYPAVSGFDAGVWTVAKDGLSVLQSINGQPTMFYSDFAAFNTTFTGNIVVETGSDDDLVGFALGFRPGDSTNPDADYLLVDWKKGTQNWNFGSPSCTGGGVAEAGLALSRVTGIPTADEFWSHENFDAVCSDLDSGLVELARANTLGSTAWGASTTYEFRFDFTASLLRVFVDGVLELEVAGSFDNGRVAFYNFSQSSVRYSGFTLTPLGACCNEAELTCVDGVAEADCTVPGATWSEGLTCADLGCLPRCEADIDDSGAVGFNDLSMLLGAWGACPGCPQDLDGNGAVGFDDLTLLLGNWGPCP